MKMRKGFTLVELLIVIVIIGVLAAAMLLSTGSATASAKASTIISDLRSMKSAILLLYADSMDNMPAVNTLITANGAEGLKKYIDNAEKYKTTAGYEIAESGGKWFIGYDTDKLGSDKGEVREKLADKAVSVGLYKSASTAAGDLYTKTDTKVFMVAR